MERRSAFDDAMGTIGTLLFGAVIGAAVALLVAPKSGQELRRDLAKEAERVGERLSETSHDLTESVKGRVNDLCCCAGEPTGFEAETAAEETGSPQ